MCYGSEGQGKGKRNKKRFVFSSEIGVRRLVFVYLLLLCVRVRVCRGPNCRLEVPSGIQFCFSLLLRGSCVVILALVVVFFLFYVANSLSFLSMVRKPKVTIPKSTLVLFRVT